MIPNSLQELAGDLLLTLKKEEPPEALLTALAETARNALRQQLLDDEQKKAFWINCYNAFFLYLRRERGMIKPAIFRERLCPIAGHKFSLDEIEHGILRRYRAKLALGYLPNLLAPAHIRQLAVRDIDFRIHFALNCGAVSCPPIAFYTAEKITQQLDLASASFLENETTILPTKKEIHFSRLGYWYLGDFGGYQGIRTIVQRYLKQDVRGYRIIFKDYNWDENLHNFAEA